jgi:hypothetical protein
VLSVLPKSKPPIYLVKILDIEATGHVLEHPKIFRDATNLQAGNVLRAAHTTFTATTQP